MNKFEIDNVVLNYPDFSHSDDLNFSVVSNPKNYKLKGFESIDNVISQVEKSLSEDSCLVIDKQVFNIFFKSALPKENEKIFLVDAREENKNIETVLSICNFFSKNNINKGSNVLVIGGGILQDLGGTSSYLYKRGIPWTYFPSTLLGISDSCLGGKTAVNFGDYKNLLGLFSAPSEIILCSDFIETLSRKDLECGYGEIFRLLITGGEKSFNVFNENILPAISGTEDSLNSLILNSLLIKKAVVEKDEFEINIRKSMNYGHTIGHALEAMSNYSIPHGIGVCLGILIENDLFSKLDLMPSRLNEKIVFSAKKIISNEYIHILQEMNFNQISEHLKKDKKTIGSKANFTYLENLGNMKFSYTEVDDIQSNLEKSKMDVIEKLLN